MSNKTEFFSWLKEATKYGPALQRYQKLEYEIEYLTGYNLEKLRYMFAKGFTLEPPKPCELTLAEIAKLVEGDNDETRTLYL